MGKNSDIQWTDHTWNPWMGCRKVSAGCKNCYWYRDAARFGRDAKAVVRSKTKFFEPLKWKEPGMVFPCSWSDFFIKDADPWRDEAWNIIRKTPHLTYQILTKRPENIKDRLPDDWPLQNVWLGVTAENQEQADIRIPVLLRTPAILRFVSVEPMIGPVKMAPEWMLCLTEGQYMNILECGHGLVDWVICGGESGTGFREIQVEWAESLKKQCDDSGWPFFMKQMAGIRPKEIPIPDHLNIKEFPKCK